MTNNVSRHLGSDCPEYGCNLCTEGPFNVTITREPLFNGHGSRFPYSWLYTVTVPGERPMVGKGIDWARPLARKHAARLGVAVVEAFDKSVKNPAKAAGMPGA